MPFRDERGIIIMVMDEQKKRLRKIIKEKVAGLDRIYTKAADQDIFSYVTGLPEYCRAETIFCFAGTGHEIDTAPIIEHALKQGKKVGVPKCVAKGVMEVRGIKGLRDLEPGKYGIPEPGSQAPVIQPEDIDLAVVPCLSCGSDGRRLGYGGGYYDRYMDRTRAVKAVICRERIMCEDIPMDVHDKQMDIVISEKGVRRLRSM